MNFAASALCIVATLLVAILLATTSTLVAFAFVLPAALVVLFVAISASEQENRDHHREDNWRHW